MIFFHFGNEGSSSVLQMAKIVRVTETTEIVVHQTTVVYLFKPRETSWRRRSIIDQQTPRPLADNFDIVP